MELNLMINRLQTNAERIRVLVEGVGADDARWKPAPDAWSVLEVVNHLFDEEREDFRVRLDIVLDHPDTLLVQWTIHQKCTRLTQNNLNPYSASTFDRKLNDTIYWRLHLFHLSTVR